MDSWTHACKLELKLTSKHAKPKPICNGQNMPLTCPEAVQVIPLGRNEDDVGGLGQQRRAQAALEQRRTVDLDRNGVAVQRMIESNTSLVRHCTWPVTFTKFAMRETTLVEFSFVSYAYKQ